jgi:hypothetical protein
VAGWRVTYMYKFLKQICSCCSRSLSDHQLEYNNRSTEMSSESQGIPALVAHHAAGRINPPPPQRSISPYANGFMSATTGGSSSRRRCNHVYPITSEEEMEPTTAPALQATRIIIRTWDRERWVTVWWPVHFVIDNHFFVAAELMMFCECRIISCVGPSISCRNLISAEFLRLCSKISGFSSLTGYGAEFVQCQVGLSM